MSEMDAPAKSIFTLVGVPIDCTGRATGVERLPAALRAAGLTRSPVIKDAGDLPVAIASSVRDPDTGIIAFAEVCTLSATIRNSLRQHLQQGRRPLVVGGCCTLLVGVAAALRDHFGHVGLAFVDGNLDFYAGNSSPTGEAADMELGILCGHGPAGLVDLAGAPPLIDPADVIVLGYRDGLRSAADGALNPRAVAPKMALYEAETLLRYGLAAAGAAVEERFRFEPGYFWLHLDLDVLADHALPAVDYPQPGGLDWAQLAALLQPLVRSPALVGMDITILNPTLDPSGRYARQTVDWLYELWGLAS